MQKYCVRKILCSNFMCRVQILCSNILVFKIGNICVANTSSNFMCKNIVLEKYCVVILCVGCKFYVRKILVFKIGNICVANILWLK